MTDEEAAVRRILNDALVSRPGYIPPDAVEAIIDRIIEGIRSPAGAVAFEKVAARARLDHPPPAQRTAPAWRRGMISHRFRGSSGDPDECVCGSSRGAHASEEEAR